MDQEGPSESLSAGLVIDQLTFERLGPVIGHLSVGLLESVSQVTLITPAKAALGLSLGPVRVIRHRPLRWPLWERGFEGILRELRSGVPNVIHAFSKRSFRLGEELAIETARPLVLHLLSTADVETGVRQSGRRVHLVAASAPLQRAAQQQRPGGSVSLIRPGLLSSGLPICFSRAGLLPTILCMSAFEPETGVDRLIRATRLLVDEGQDLMLLLLGRGPSERQLRKLVESEGLIKHVTFGERIMDWDLVMRTADIFVVPGVIDRLDVRLLHALAAGLAAVSCAMPNSDFMVNEKTGLVCEQPTAEHLAAAIRRLLDDRSMARRLATAGLEHCRQHHSLNTMAMATAATYQEAIASYQAG